MTRFQKFFLLILCSLAGLSVWWLMEHSSGFRDLQVAKQVLRKQMTANEQLRQENRHYARQLTALHCDDRVLEREARDQLLLAKKGELVIVLPR